jgi:hypothetical protein
VVTFVIVLVGVPWIVVRIPADYFAAGRRPTTPWTKMPPAVHWLLIVGKNLLGWIFVIAGIAMLFLPGQGVLTILVGLMLVDLPGKYRLERWIISRGPVLKSMNWVRRRAGRPPLVVRD